MKKCLTFSFFVQLIPLFFRRKFKRSVMEGAETLDTETTKDKKPRKRMKALYGRIKQQMEFYFSDSNLSRDRYMKKQIQEAEDGYISLDIFLRFNKIKDLTLDSSVIASALKKSKLLQVSKDGTNVKRTKPVSSAKDIDDRTVYVECLPHNVDHEYIRRIFASCGSVLYVSIPRYKSTGDSKGFAFIEFDTVESAHKACEELNNPPAEAGDKPGKFPRTSKQMTHLQKALQLKEDVHISPEKSITESPSKSAKKRKRRRQTSEGSVDGGENTKQIKLEYDNKDQPIDVSHSETDNKDLSVSKTDESGEKELVKNKSKKRKKSKGEGQISVTESETSDQCSESDRETRKRKTLETVDAEIEPPPKICKKEETCDNKENTESEISSVSQRDEKSVTKIIEKKKKNRHHKTKHKDIPELRVISKKEWLDLRTEYLKLQKESMNKLKKTLTKVKKEEKDKEMKEKEKEKEKEMFDDKKSTNRPKIEFVADVIVYITSGQPLYRKEVKEDLGTCYQIAYIDIKEGDKSGHIRMEDSDSAKRLAEATSGSYFFTLLKGQEEKDYWNKLYILLLFIDRTRQKRLLE
ncbi:la-related protein 7-like isoform X7 [Mytilus californianus]|uniref:la-related protein 7-like isoform X7 n=1 Tax=Mytilus californianus TaxID=6549 RepID=UPI00224514FA|nr:la-related protein 7-like isoform X7 [Mytilus californianus]